MACSTPNINYNPVHVSTRHQDQITSRDPTYLLGLLDAMDSDDSDEEFDGYVDLQDHTHTSMDVHIQDETTDDQDISTHDCTLTMNTDTATTIDPIATDLQPTPLSCSPSSVATVDQEGSSTSTALDQLDSQPTATTGSPPPDEPLPDFSESSGVVPDMSNKQPSDFFDLLFSADIIDNIHHQTNLYAQQYLESKSEHLQQHPQSRIAAYQGKPIKVSEIKATLALIIIMGIVNLPSLSLYWSSKWPFRFPAITSILSRNRFQLILKFLHFNDNTNHIPRGQVGHDKLFKLRPFLTMLITNFQQMFTPFKYISVDESMIGFKGRISFLQYLPKKPKKWGMKAWALCDSKTGYTWNWKLYVGKDDEVATSDGLAYGVVMELVKKLTNKGYHLYCDNFYSSPKLFHQLYKLGIGACGTVRLDRRGLPIDFKKAKLLKGEITTFRDGNLMGLKWMDKRQVSMISTIHDDTIIDKRRRTRQATGGVETIKKPKVVDEYNSHMGGVDKADQLITYYGFSHRTCKWYKRVFFHLFEVSIVNAYILYCMISPPKQQLSHIDFRLAIAKHLILSSLTSSNSNTTISDSNPSRLIERHFLALREKGTRDCMVCSDRQIKKRKQTKYYCKQCQVSMCPVPCFERYHTLVNYKL